ncbi:MAG: phosphoribosyltransferase [Limnospira sp.]
MSDLYISWTEYYRKIEILAAKIYQSQWAFDQIVCIARGGMRIGDVLSRIYSLPLAILATSSYGGSQGQNRGEIRVAHHLTMTAENLGRNVLLVDDLVDSGTSIDRSVAWLMEHYPDEIQEIRTAVLWYKSCSSVAPDYYVDYLSDDPWIHQPFECYEKIRPADLLHKDAIATEVRTDSNSDK